MISGSTHKILWLRPDIEEERWEYFSHPDKQSFYQQHGITWQLILSRFEQGMLTPYHRSEKIDTISVSRSCHRWEDYSRYLAKAKRGYRLNYSKMEDDLQRNGCLTLKAPIILSVGDDGLLFSGYRRLCLAWNYGMVPFAWLVNLYPV